MRKTLPWIGWCAFLACLVSCGCRSTPGAGGQPTLLDSGVWEYRLNGNPTGRESYRLLEAPDGGTVCEVLVEFFAPRLLGQGKLERDAAENPTSYQFSVSSRGRPSRHVQVQFLADKIVQELRTGDDAPKVTNFPRTEGLRVIEEGVFSFDQLLLTHYDRTRKGEQHFRVFVPQFGKTADFHVSYVSEESMEVPAGKSLATHLRVRYEGATLDYWLDAEGRLVKYAGPAAAGTAEALRVH